MRAGPRRVMQIAFVGTGAPRRLLISVVHVWFALSALRLLRVPRSSRIAALPTHAKCRCSQALPALLLSAQAARESQRVARRKARETERDTDRDRQGAGGADRESGLCVAVSATGPRGARSRRPRALRRHRRRRQGQRRRVGRRVTVCALVLQLVLSGLCVVAAAFVLAVFAAAHVHTRAHTIISAAPEAGAARVCSLCPAPWGPFDRERASEGDSRAHSPRSLLLLLSHAKA